MFYELIVKGHIRVDPRILNENIEESVKNNIMDMFENYMMQDLIPEIGIVVDIREIMEIGEGVIIPGDGAAYYDTKFKLITFKPELHEIVLGNVSQISDFGAFMTIGPIDGMVHISQAMDDFVSFSKSGTLQGKQSKRALKIDDKCRARIIAASYKDPLNPRIGLTMRQATLGNLNWIEEEIKKSSQKQKKETKK